MGCHDSDSESDVEPFNRNQVSLVLCGRLFNGPGFFSLMNWLNKIKSTNSSSLTPLTSTQVTRL